MRPIAVRLSWVACGLLGSAAPMAAQGRPLIAGDQVRVMAPTLESSPVIGTVIDSRTGALILRRASGDTVVVPTASVTRVQVSQGSRPHTLTGAIVGTASGAVIGGVIGAASNDMGPLALGRGGLIVVGAGMGAAAGVVIGAGIGRFIRTPRWHDASVEITPPVVSAAGSGAKQLARVRVAVSWLGD